MTDQNPADRLLSIIKATTDDEWPPQARWLVGELNDLYRSVERSVGDISLVLNGSGIHVADGLALQVRDRLACLERLVAVIDEDATEENGLKHDALTRARTAEATVTRLRAALQHARDVLADGRKDHAWRCNWASVAIRDGLEGCNTPDGLHCTHWYDNERCCKCGTFIFDADSEIECAAASVGGDSTDGEAVVRRRLHLIDAALAGGPPVPCGAVYEPTLDLPNEVTAAPTAPEASPLVVVRPQRFGELGPCRCVMRFGDDGRPIHVPSDDCPYVMAERSAPTAPETATTDDDEMCPWTGLPMDAEGVLVESEHCWYCSGEACSICLGTVHCDHGSSERHDGLSAANPVAPDTPSEPT